MKFKDITKLIISLTTIAVALIFTSWYLLNWLYPLPDRDQDQYALNIRSSEGQTLRQFADKNGIFRMAVDVEDVAEIYIDSLIAYEDSGFYEHNGVDFSALLRATWQRVRYGEIVSGGSTITMQVARILYPIERSYTGKFVQLFRARQLEDKLSKREILNLYLTHAPMGGNIEGVEAASQRYFDKSSKNLGISEAALLTVIPQRPSIYRPDRYPDKAFNARNKVLKRLIATKLLTKDEYLLLKNEPVKAGRTAIKRKVPLLARELKSNQKGESELSTFIIRQLQQNLDTLIAHRFLSISSDLSVAAMVMENTTGNVIAYKGSRNMDEVRSFGHVDMTKAIRSPGSTLKPFIYAQALDEGLIHSESLLLDIPMDFGDYKPQNFDTRFQGEVSVSEALLRSKNISAVYLLSQIGVSKFVDKMQILSSSLRLADLNLTVALGGGGSTLRELMMYYTAFNRKGVAIKPRLSNSDPILEASLMSTESAWITKVILEDNRAPDRVRAKYGRKVAWKTGTSFGYRDAWAIGSSADYTVGVWIGRPDGSPYVGQTGATMAAPILFDLFDLLPKDKLKISKPYRVEHKSICWPSGWNAKLVTQENCQQKRVAWTIDGVTPRTLSRDMRLTKANQWPQELRSWKKLHTESKHNLDIISPLDGSHIYPYTGQIIDLKASSKSVRWYLDGRPTEMQLNADMLNGKHQIKACNHYTCSSVTITIN